MTTFKYARLGDDGTLDTVIYCAECGAETRFNYDPAISAEDANDVGDYDAFVGECLEEFESEHDCGEDTE